MIQRGQKGEQRHAPIRPEYAKWRLTTQRRRHYQPPFRQLAELLPLFLIGYSLFCGQQLFWNRI